MSAIVQTLFWLPESLCERLETRLQILCNDWAATWGLPPPSGIEVQRVSGSDGSPETVAIDLLAPPCAAWRKALAQALLKAAAGESFVVEGVVRRVTEELQAALRRDFAPQAAQTSAGQQPGHRGVRVWVELAGRRCTLSFDNAQLRASGWLTRPSTPALATVNAERALAALAVPLKAELGRASVNVADLLQLAPGDVLVLNESLETPLRVVSPGSALSLTARLGANPTTACRAARWLAHP